MTVSLDFSDAWMATYPDAAIGLLAMTPVGNSPPSPALQSRLSSIESMVKRVLIASAAASPGWAVMIARPTWVAPG